MQGNLGLPRLRELLIAGVLLWLPTASAQTLRVGFFDLLPHVQAAVVPDQEASGPAIDYLREIAGKIGVNLLIDRETLPLDRLLKALEGGEIDLVLALGKSPERENIGHFPARPFFRMQPSLLLLKSSPLQAIRSVEDLKKLRIGVYSAGYMSPLMRSPGLRLEKLHGNQVTLRNVRKMQLGRLDAVYTPDASEFACVLGDKTLRENIRILSLPEPPLGLYSVFAKNVDPALIKRYEQVLAGMAPYPRYLEQSLSCR